MGLFTRFLKLSNPVQGRKITEDGNFYNEADHLKDEAMSLVAMQSLRGNLFRCFYSAQIASGATDTFILDIPSGVEVYGNGRFVTVLEGTVEAQYLTGGSAGATQQTISPRNFDQRDSQPVKLSQTKFLKVASVAGATAESPLRVVYSPTTTGARAPSTQTEAGGVVPLDNTIQPVFTVKNIGGAATNYILELYFSEIVTQS